MSKYQLSAEEIRRIRRALGETQAQFAGRLYVDAVTVARWETDRRKCTGLYAKTIADLDPQNSPTPHQELKMDIEQDIKIVPLHQLYRFSRKLSIPLQYLDREVPVKERDTILQAYQEWFECDAYSNDMILDVCHERLVREIGYFCRPFLRGPLHPEKGNGYVLQKLGNAHQTLLEIARDIAPQCESAKSDRIEPNLTPRERLLSIQFILDELLLQPNLREADIALLKFYRALQEFAWTEMSRRKKQPIPVMVSFALGRLLSIFYQGPFTVSVPTLDDSTNQQYLREASREIAWAYQAK